MASGKVRDQGSKVRVFDDDVRGVALAEIKAEVEKSEQRLVFSGVVLILTAMCFIIRTCATHPVPHREDDSVLCVKAGGQWHVAAYDKDGHHLDAFCSKDKD